VYQIIRSIIKALFLLWWIPLTTIILSPIIAIIVIMDSDDFQGFKEGFADMYRDLCLWEAS
jgi:hypothetical protein